jgi:hypothetical protein
MVLGRVCILDGHDLYSLPVRLLPFCAERHGVSIKKESALPPLSSSIDGSLATFVKHNRGKYRILGVGIPVVEYG